MSQQRDPERERHWREIVAGWRQSGQTVRGFCAARRLSEASLYAWRRELVQRDRAGRPQARQPRRLAQRPIRPRAKFIPVQVLPSLPLEVVLPTGIVVRVPAGAEATAIASLVAALRATSC